MKQLLLALIILGSLSLENPSLAIPYKLQDEITAYNQSNYRQVITIGNALAIQNPYDPRHHYYLANAYVRLGQTKDAIEEYSFCDKITQDPQLKAYCNQALNELINSPTSANNNFHLYTSKTITDAQANQAPKQAAREAQANQIAMQTAQSIQTAQMPSLPGHNQYAIQPAIAYPNVPAQTLPILNSSAPDRYANFFDRAPLPPPPFPASALKGAEKTLQQKIN